MLETAGILLLGAFIGWNFPQPWWAKLAQEKVTNWFKRNDA